MISLKKEFLLIVGCFLVLSLLNGCSSLGVPAPAPTPPAPPPPAPTPPARPGPETERDRAFLYFFRTERFPFSIEAVPILVNDRLVTRLKNKSYTWISIPTGKYKVRLEYGGRVPASESPETSSGSDYNSEEVNLTVETGRSYFFRAKEVFEHKTEYGLLPIIRFSLDPIPQIDALDQIKGTDYLEPEELGFGDGESLKACRGPVACN